MEREQELAIIRAAYAKQTLAAATFFETTIHLGVSAWVGVADNVRLEAALSVTRREDFLGAGPWQIFRRFQVYVTTPDADPVYLYTDDIVGILPDRKLNSGQPSFLAYLIHQASPRAGEHAMHIGAGTGYYTATGSHRWAIGSGDRNRIRARTGRPSQDQFPGMAKRRYR